MQKIFNKVMIPVSGMDLDRDAVGKAAAFANQMDCHLHVLCIQPSLKFQFNKNKNLPVDTEELENNCRDLMKQGLKLRIVLCEKGSVSVLRQYQELNNIDLLVICNEISPNCSITNFKKAGDISSLVNSPVLYAPNLSNLIELRKIILPLDELLPVNKIRIAIYLAGHFNAEIHLLAVQDKNSNENMDYLKRAYAVLKENSSQSFVCRTVLQKDLTKAAVEYAREIQAGLVMAKPFTEKNISFLFKPLFRLFSGKRKEVAVMAVN